MEDQENVVAEVAEELDAVAEANEAEATNVPPAEDEAVIEEDEA